MAKQVLSDSVSVPVSEVLQTGHADRDQALRKAKREVRLKEAQWRQKRAEVARLIAVGEEEVADELLRLVPSETERTKVHSEITDASTLAKESPKKQQDKRQPSQVEDLRHLDPNEKSAKRRSNGDSKETVRSNAKQTAKGRHKGRLNQVVNSTRRKTRRTTLGRILNTWGLWISKRPAWAVSLTLHTAMLLLLMLATFATLQEEAFVLTASIADGEEWADEMPEISLVNWEVQEESLEIETKLEALAVEPMLEPVDLKPDDSLDGELTESLPSAAEMFSRVSTGNLSSGAKDSEVAGTASKPSEGTENSETSKPMGKVSFFGVRERADRVVFVVDNSGSMQRGRMETTLNELNRAVQSLSPHQSYYVIFYSDQAYPMFFPNSIEELQPATRDSKRQFAKWLRTIEICLGGRLLDAIEMAAELEPQVVFLMSDGDIRSTRVMQSLTEPDAWPFTIHSFGMEVRTKKHAENLAAISKANEGEFRVVDVRPKAIRQSMLKPIPYHREPGKVWGSQVQVWSK